MKTCKKGYMLRKWCNMMLNVGKGMHLGHYVTAKAKGQPSITHEIDKT